MDIELMKMLFNLAGEHSTAVEPRAEVKQN
jgi:hypothetical protein